MNAIKVSRKYNKESPQNWLRSLFLLVLMGWVGFSYGTTKLTSLSELQFKDLEGQKVTQSDLPHHQALLLIYFRSDCDHCRQMTQYLRYHATSYPLQIWLVSAEEQSELDTYEYMMGLTDVPNLRLLQDFSQAMHDWFDFDGLPFCVLYNSDGQSLSRFDYLPTIEEVKQLLKP